MAIWVQSNRLGCIFFHALVSEWPRLGGTWRGGPLKFENLVHVVYPKNRNENKSCGDIFLQAIT